MKKKAYRVRMASTPAFSRKTGATTIDQDSNRKIPGNALDVTDLVI